MQFGKHILNPLFVVGFKKGQTCFENGKNNYWIDVILTPEAQQGYHPSVKPSVAFMGNAYSSDTETKEARDDFFNTLNTTLNLLFVDGVAKALAERQATDAAN